MEFFSKQETPSLKTTYGFEVRGAELRVRTYGTGNDDVIEVYRSVEDARLASEFLRDAWVKQGYRPEAAAPSVLLLGASRTSGGSVILGASGAAARTPPTPVKRIKVRETLPLKERLELEEAEFDGDALVSAKIQGGELAGILKKPVTDTLQQLVVYALEEEDCALAAKTVLAKKLPRLRSLTHCDYRAVEDFADARLELGKFLAKLPQLRSLTLRAQTLTLDKAAESSALEDLELCSASMSSETLEALARTKWPALRRLSLWLGGAHEGATYTVGSLERLFASDGLGALRSLELHTCEPADSAVEALLRSPLLPRLATVELSHSLLGDAGLGALVRERARLTHLSSLRFEEIQATRQAIEALIATGLPVTASRGSFTSVEQFVPGGPRS